MRLKRSRAEFFSASARETAGRRRTEFLPFGQPLISEEEIEAVAEVLRSGWIGMGERTLEFEKAFSMYTGARHAVSVSSCTAGLHLALIAAGVGEGDEVITTPMTFVATVNAILQVSATPVLADIDPCTLNIEPEAVARRVTSKTRALLPVHFGGLACDLDGLGSLARRHCLSLIEDAAHAAGARFLGKAIGGHGNMAVFSFYPNKNMTTVEGGMITTDDDRIAEQLRLLRLQGLSSDAWRRFSSKEPVAAHATCLGYKYNLTDVQAVLGLGQLARLEEFLAMRERYAEIYDHEFADLPIDRQNRPKPGLGERHGLHLYVILLRLEDLTSSRDEVVQALRRRNIGAGVHYCAIHEHPYHGRMLRYRSGDLPVAESISRRTLTLPLSASMDEEDLWDVIHAVRAVLTRSRKRKFIPVNRQRK
ncbi:MAG: DegT/DnrJ/EryC1/StrS family aminotransferase [Acidobacteria bacterium]|nr:DegT/DnrJ/EryC1/StrS family aminotransferase [Acidobacteriota bacterium]